MLRRIKFNKNNLKRFVACLLGFSQICGVGIMNASKDWAQFSRYRQQNNLIKAQGENSRPDVIFMGNSITEGWVKEDPQFFKENNFEGRGISGQSSYQMLSRFREDVLNLNPKIVLINAGTNDIAENTHEYNEDITFGNIISMVELARVNNIEVVLSSILPADKFYWNENVKDIPEKIISLNSRIQKYAEENGIPFLDYHSQMIGNDFAMKDGFSLDGVHPTIEGYKVMEEIAYPVLMKMIDKDTAGRSSGKEKELSFSPGLSKSKLTKEEAVDYLIKTYPKAQLADVYKSFYQDNFGPGHLLEDSIGARRYFMAELEDTTLWGGPDIEFTGEGKNFVRVNMDLVRKGVIPADAYFQAFQNSLGRVEKPADEFWIAEWEIIDSIIKEKNFHFINEEGDRALIDEKIASRNFPIHHSDNFNENYNFHYRIISIPEFEKLKIEYDIQP